MIKDEEMPEVPSKKARSVSPDSSPSIPDIAQFELEMLQFLKPPTEGHMEPFGTLTRQWWNKGKQHTDKDGICFESEREALIYAIVTNYSDIEMREALGFRSVDITEIVQQSDATLRMLLNRWNELVWRLPEGRTLFVKPLGITVVRSEYLLQYLLNK